jgi:hypothetical protein
VRNARLGSVKKAATPLTNARHVNTHAVSLVRSKKKHVLVRSAAIGTVRVVASATTVQLSVSLATKHLAMTATHVICLLRDANDHAASQRVVSVPSILVVSETFTFVMV